MSNVAWLGCLTWLSVAAIAAALGARRSFREGRGKRALARRKSPTVCLFAAYLHGVNHRESVCASGPPARGE